MADIRTPFYFVNPERYSSSSQRARSKARRPATLFSRFSRLPYEIRQEIILFAISYASKYREEWLRGQCSPVVLQSRRGVLRVQSQHREPPSLPQLACVSLDWQEQIEKQLFMSLRLRILPNSRSDEDSDLAAFAVIVTESRRQYLINIRLDSYREYPTYPRSGSGEAQVYRTGGSYECIVRFFQILGAWPRGHVRDDSLTVELDIELQDFSLHHLSKAIGNLPSIPVVRTLEINMNSKENSKFSLALVCLLRKLPQLEFADFQLSPWCFSNENDKDREIQGEHMRSM